MHLFGLSLGEGNRKIGDVFSFSLPSGITCPGHRAQHADLTIGAVALRIDPLQGVLLETKEVENA